MTNTAYKNYTFLIGVLIMCAGALTDDYPDWDLTISVIQPIWAYFTAQAFVEVMMDLDWKRMPLALFNAWVGVDGIYWVYWEVVNPSVMIREGQWPMSLCLFLLCGFIWRAGPPWHRMRQEVRP